MKINLTQAWLRVMLGMLLVPKPGLAAEASRLTCPDVVPAPTIKVDSVLEEWTPSVLSDFRLTAAGFNNGPPEKRADLKPHSVTEKRQRSAATWLFDEGGFADGLWLACSYGGAAGEIILARKLPDGYRSCSVNYRPGSKAGAQLIEITCR